MTIRTAEQGATASRQNCLQHFLNRQMTHEYHVEITARLVHGIRRPEIVVRSVSGTTFSRPTSIFMVLGNAVPCSIEFYFLDILHS